MQRKFTKKQQQYIDYVYKTLSSLGYDRYSISGILGNALTESGLDADSVSKSKTYSGGWLNHKTVRLAIEDQYGDYSLKNQLKYIHDWNTRADHIIKGKYSPYTAMNAGKYKTAGYKNAKEAADAFMKLYERPVIMENGKIVGYQGAADRYANADEIYNYLNTAYKPKGDMQVVTMSDGNRVMTISPRMYERPQYEPEFKLYHDPKTVYLLNPAAREVPESLDAWNGADSPSKGPRMPSLTKLLDDLLRDNPLNGGFKPEATIYGRRRLSLLSLKLPSLDQMLDLGSPQQQLTEYFADALQVPRMHLDVLPAAKDGKDALPKYGDGTRMIYNDDGTWSRITDDNEANLLSNLVVTPKGIRPRFDYESNPNYKRPILKNAAISRDDWASTKRDIEKARSTRTWISDAADAAHAIGEGIFTAAGFINPEMMVAANAAYNTAKQAAIKLATSNSTAMLYVRYPIGKALYGLDAKFPTLYRKVKSLPTEPENGMVLVSNPKPRFAFANTGEESPIITNFTYDAPVRAHSNGNWDGGFTIAIPGRKALLGKNVISTEASDLFTYGDDIKMPLRDVTIISGDADEIAAARQYGYKVHTTPELQSLWEEGYSPGVSFKTSSGRKINIRKEDFSKYAKQVELESRKLFRSPTKKDVSFMNFVLQPKIKGLVYDPSQLDYLIREGIEPFGDRFGNSWARGYFLDPERWQNLLYDPITHAESNFRNSMGIVLKKDVPLNMRKFADFE